MISKHSAATWVIYSLNVTDSHARKADFVSKNNRTSTRVFNVWWSNFMNLTTFYDQIAAYLYL